MAEEILVVRRDIALDYGLLKQGFFRIDPDGAFEVFNNGLFMLRCEALENDERFKQLIPYVVIMHRDPTNSSPPLVYAYRRGGGGESRLHGRRSVGVGGHVNKLDGRASLAAFLEGQRRELDEEVKIHGGELESIPYAAINDDSTPVGRVHLGLVSRYFLAEPKVESLEADLADDGLHPLPDLLADLGSFERWSQFVLHALHDDYMGVTNGDSHGNAGTSPPQG